MARSSPFGADRAPADLALQALLQAFVDKYRMTALPLLTSPMSALRQDADKAFEWLERAWSSRDSKINSLLFDRTLPRSTVDTPRRLSR